MNWKLAKRWLLSKEQWEKTPYYQTDHYHCWEKDEIEKAAQIQMVFFTDIKL